MNNIRFYYKSIDEKKANGDLISAFKVKEYTAAHLIAMTCANLQITCTEFFEAFIFDTFDDSFTSLFGTIASSYLSYVLGNLLMEINHMNDEDFEANSELYKRYINLYIDKRERSEVFILREIKKQNRQQYCHNTVHAIKNLTDFKNKICKGNRMSNIGSIEYSEEEGNAELEEDIKKDENISEDNQDDDVKNVVHDHQVDPVFQTMRNHENLLNYVYKLLAKRVCLIQFN